MVGSQAGSAPAGATDGGSPARAPFPRPVALPQHLEGMQAEKRQAEAALAKEKKNVEAAQAAADKVGAGGGAGVQGAGRGWQEESSGPSASQPK